MNTVSLVFKKRGLKKKKKNPTHSQWDNQAVKE